MLSICSFVVPFAPSLSIAKAYFIDKGLYILFFSPSSSVRNVKSKSSIELVITSNGSLDIASSFFSLLFLLSFIEEKYTPPSANITMTIIITIKFLFFFFDFSSFATTLFFSFVFNFLFFFISSISPTLVKYYTL